MRLVRGELLKLRKRWATYVVLGIVLGLMTLVYLLIGVLARGATSDAAGLVTRFPAAYGVINQFVFGLGSLLAVAYAAAIAGADWSYGVIRVFIARGESRSWYVLAKAIGLAITLAIGVLIAYAVGMLLTLLASMMLGVDPGQPLGETGVRELVASLALGGFVLLQRAAIGFAVAMVLRSQLAGVVVGIVLFIAEPILSGILFALSLGGNLVRPTVPSEVQWYQFLPFSVGDSVLARSAPAASGAGGIAMPSIALDIALIAVGAYLVVALGAAMWSLRRAQVTA